MSTLLKRVIFSPGFYSPVVANGVLPDIRNAAAINLRNAGTATVNLQNGLWTLAPGETISWNVHDGNTIDFTQINVSFDTSTGSVKSLQITTLILNNYC
jgi:hypothetical protein